MAKSTYHQISKDLYLIQAELSTAATSKVIVDAPTNHFLCVDCSGSMWNDLPKIREQLKRKLPKLLKAQDTVSIVWFSGRREFGTLLEGEPVATLTDLKTVEQAIDRWLKPCGLTGFTEPLQEAGKVVKRVAKAGSVNSLMFLSDGCDNQGTRAGILKAMEEAAGSFQSTTIVEYGYYADRNLLSAMAEKAGGVHIFSEDFASYSPTFEAVMQKRPTGAPKVEVPVEGEPINGFVFSLQDEDLVTYSVEAGSVKIPETLKTFWYASPTPVGIGSKMHFPDNVAYQVSANSEYATNVKAAFAAVSLYAVRMKPNVVYPILKVLGDVSFIEEFSSCFGKQRYSSFQERAKKAAFGEGLFTKGYDPSKVPADDAFTVLDLLQLLASDENNRVLLDHPDFTYSRIGRGRVDSSDKFTPDEQAELETLIQELQDITTTQRTSSKKLEQIQAVQTRIAAIHASKPSPLVFEPDPALTGYSISTLVFNEDRPNVSFMVRKTGTVDLTARLERDGFDKVPDVLNTHVFRNYAVIKDGLVNIDKLPVNLTLESYDTLKSALGAQLDEVFQTQYLTAGAVGAIGVLNLRSLPVINRKMIREVSAKKFFQLQYDLLTAQAEQKVYNSFQKELAPKERSQGLRDLYGEDGADWLKEQGITDGGFSPKGTLADAKDFYMGKELKVSIKGYSKLPSLKEAQANIAKGKVNGPTALMQEAIRETEDFIAKAAGKTEAIRVWLDVQADAAKRKVRQLIFQLSQSAFAIVVGQTWFSEFSSLDEGTMTIEPVSGTKLECKAELKEIEIKI